MYKYQNQNIHEHYKHPHPPPQQHPIQKILVQVLITNEYIGPDK